MSTANVTRRRIVHCLPLVLLAAVVMLCGVGAAQAQRYVQPYANAHTAHAIKDKSVNQKLTPAVRARVQRAEAIKKKQQAQEYVQRMVQEEGASATGGKEDAK